MAVLDRYARALRALEEHLARRASGGEEDEAAFLRRHEDLGDVLAPMLQATGGGDDTLAGPAAAPPWRGLPAEGEVVGGYRVERLLGQGGMGVVFLASDERLQRKVALKLLRPERLGLGAARERFLREAKLAARVEHPGICPVYEVGDAADMPFMAMRFLEGESLAARLAKRRQDPTPLTEGECDEFVRIAECAARALHHAHGHGIVHRDVKPANILVEPDGTPVLLDFGMARSGDDFALTMTGELAGTPLYMSPEQVTPSARGVDHRADVYGLGVTLYEAVAGAPPFQGTTMHELLEAIVRRDPPPLRRGATQVSRDLDVVIGKAIDKDRDRRYLTAAEFADDLARVRQRLPVLARRLGPIVRARRWAQRNPLPVGLFGLAVAALVVISVFYVRAENARADFALMSLVSRARELRESEPGLYAAWPDHAPALRAWLREAEAVVAEEPTVRAANADLATAYAAGDRAAAVLHEALQTILREIGDLVDPTRGTLHRVRRDLDWAERERPERAPEPADVWVRACTAVAASPRYRGLTLAPQVGLVPLGEDPHSGLWEFAHLRSGVPAAREGDRLVVLPETGIVFVLLPGGTFRMGAQNNPGAADHDSMARADEAPPNEVDLAPFFLGKHELTQAQWMRLGDGDNPSDIRPGKGFRVPITLAHPLESVTWPSAVTVLGRHGLALPTEAQWEYACRGGTASPWWTGDDELALSGRVNVADAAAKRANAPWREIDVRFEDGYVVHAPVDALAPNGLGLHHIAGNVYELCRDPLASYDIEPAVGDGLRVSDSSARVARGGAFDKSSVDARSAMRRKVELGDRGNNTGVRPARAIR